MSAERTAERTPETMKAGAVLFVKDLARVAKFYAELVPMVGALSESDLIVLESSNFQLVVHPIPKRIAKTINITSPPARRTNIAVKLIFPVASLADVRAKAPTLGGELDPPSKEFVARGFRACDGHDPEGNVVQFREDAG
jgi:predicted enzyme related to lactoylglutathione lyase